MGKLYLALEDDVNLLDLVRALVAQALEILLHSPKTKAEYAKSFNSTLQVVQNMKKLLNCSLTTEEIPKKSEAETGEKMEPLAVQNTGNSSNKVAAEPDKNQQQGQSIVKIPANSVKIATVHEICSSTLSEPKRKVAKKREAKKPGNCSKMTTVSTSPVDSRTPAQKALSNSLIVQKIMQNVDSKTLKSCRSLCNLWVEEATKQLLTSRHNQVLEVKFRWSENHGEYKHSCLGTIQTFIDFCLKTSRKFPCDKFNFTGGYLNSPAFLNFFKDFGTTVKFLRLNPCTNSEAESSLAVQSFGGVLFELAPNLEGLTLDTINWTRTQDFSKNLSVTVSGAGDSPKKRGGRRKSTIVTHLQNGPQTLPNLKKVILPRNRIKFPANNSEMNRVVLNILRVAPNLVHVEDKNVYFTREIVAAGKFGLMKHLWFQFDYQKPALDARLRFFAEQKPQLETISFARHTIFSDATNTACLTSILRSSKKSLKYVHNLDEVDFEHCPFPPLENVMGLSLKPNSSLCDDISAVPPGRRLAEFFPNLKRISCEPSMLKSPSNGSTCVDSLFLEKTPLPTLILDAESLYPNLKLISLGADDHGSEHLPKTIKAICSFFPRLETLRIHMNVVSGWRYGSEMDATFTGLPISLCKDLEKNPGQGVDDETLKNLQGNGQPSIRDLTKLKEFEISLNLRSGFVQAHRLCTRVSDLYAFDLMKRRQGLIIREVVRYQI